MTAAARERFADGANAVQGVRPEILMSWYRCREEYGVDPRLDRAPAAAELSAHSIKNDVVFTELGGLATAAAREVDGLDGLVAVADPDGRILASWGSRRILRLAEDSNLAPWYTWSEWASGTNGMGTALESHGPIMVRGPEHWCRGFHPWTCAGVAVRDVVTHDPLAVLNISCWKTSLPDTALPWLSKAAAPPRRSCGGGRTTTAPSWRRPSPTPGWRLRRRSPRWTRPGTSCWPTARPRFCLGLRPTPRRMPRPTAGPSQLAILPQLASRVIEHARQDPHWSGSTQVFVPFLDTFFSVAVRPVFNSTQVIGAVLAFGSPDADPGFEAASGDPLLGSAPAQPDAEPGHRPCGKIDGLSWTQARSASSRRITTTSG